MAATDTLKALGFKEQKPDEFQKLSDEIGLSANYPHKVLYVGTKGSVTVLIEENMSEDSAGGVTSITKHPACMIVEGPKGRTVVANHDDPSNADLIAAVVESVS